VLTPEPGSPAEGPVPHPKTRSLNLSTKPDRKYPALPMVGVGGVVIRDGRALLIRRGSDPLRGEWSIPGGMLEVGETLTEGVARELLEETGLQVKVLDLIEVFERIFTEPERGATPFGPKRAGAEVIRETAPGTASLDSMGPGLGDAGAVPSASDSPFVESPRKRPLYHFVILDYLCEAREGSPHPASDVTDVAFASESELDRYRLTTTAIRVIQKAFALSRQQRSK
jgi:ADP-ribose pyrophosphatase YjhB (NUDIX family)